MCASTVSKKSLFLTAPVMYALMIMLGIVAGFSDNAVLTLMGTTIAEMFVRIFKCISLPIIALSIIVTISKYKTDGLRRIVWRRTMLYTLGTTMLAAFVACTLYWVIQPGMLVVHHMSNPDIPTETYFSHIANIIPENLISPFLSHQVISVLMLGILAGTAIRFIPDDDARTTITHFFKGAHGLFMVITNWVITIIPIGLFGFITSTVISLRQGMDIKGIGQYLLIIVLANIIQGFVILPLWLKIKGIKPYSAMRQMMPALSLAFFSKSSVGTLPVTMETAEKNLNVDKEISRFVLPLCTSLNMNGCAAFIFTTVIYLMQNHGITVTAATMLMWVVIATIAAIGNAGVPMGCFFLSASLLASMNIPITLLGVILPFYSLIDMLETSLNVWSDACVAKVVDEDLKSLSQVIQNTPPIPSQYNV